MAPVKHPSVPQPQQPAPVRPAPASPASPASPPSPASPAGKTEDKKPADTFDRSLPIKSTGWSEADVHREARTLDKNKDGRITEAEVADFRARARVAGMQDPRAAQTFARFEAGGALAAQQDKAPGRQMDKAYLDGAFTRELKKTGANATEIADVRRAIVQQSDAELGADALPELRASNGFRRPQDQAAKGVLESYGMKDAVIVDRNGDGRVDAGDRMVYTDSAGKLVSGKVFMPDEINGALGVQKVSDSHATHGKPEFMPDKPKADWFPKKHWNWDESSGNWRLNKGVSATEAIQYYRDHPTEFGGDCGAMKQLAAQSALAEQLGKKDYDALAVKEGLSIGFSGKHNSEGLSKKIVAEVGSWGDAPETYPSGSQGYTHVTVPGNAGATRALEDMNWAGEHYVVNTNAKGEKVVVAHPFGEVPAKDFEAKLRKKAADELASQGYSVRPEDIELSRRPGQSYDVEAARRIAQGP